MADVSIDEHSRLIQMGYTPRIIEMQSRTWVDKILTDPDLKMTLLDQPSPATMKQLTGFDPSYGGGGIGEALSAGIIGFFEGGVAEAKRWWNEGRDAIEKATSIAPWIIAAAVILGGVYLFRKR